MKPTFAHTANAGILAMTAVKQATVSTETTGTIVKIAMVVEYAYMADAATTAENAGQDSVGMARSGGSTAKSVQKSAPTDHD